eukprot:5149037-Prymnesium_polylepis.1
MSKYCWFTRIVSMLFTYRDRWPAHPRCSAPRSSVDAQAALCDQRPHSQRHHQHRRPHAGAPHQQDAHG